MFRITSGVAAPGIKVNLHLFKKVKFDGKNRVGKNCKIIIPNRTELRQFFLGKHSWIRDNVEINAPGESLIRLKENVSIQDNCKIIGDVTIESQCILAPDVFISSGTHAPFHRPHRLIRDQDQLVNEEFGFISNPIHIEEDCWIGKGAFILPGTYIGKGCVIGAGARVKENIPPYSVVINNNEIIKNRIEFIPPSQVISNELNIPYFYRGFSTTRENLEKQYFTMTEMSSFILLKEIEKEKIVIIKGVNLNKNAISISVNPTSERIMEIPAGNFEISLNIKKDTNTHDKLQSIFNYFILSLHCNDYKYIAIQSVKIKK